MLDSDIFLDDIQPLNEAMGLIHQVKNVKRKAPLMAGEFRFHTFAGGLSMHASHATELQDSDSALELPPGLSFNLIFNGQIDFSFGGQQYRMKNPSKDSTATCTAIINDKEEILTRHMTKDVQIEKLNIFVERKWLNNHTQNEQEHHALSRIFKHHGVIQWEPSDKVLDAAYTLLKIKQRPSLASKLELEAQTVKALSLLIEALEAQLAQSEWNDTDATSGASNESLKEQIDIALPYHHSINDLAEAINMSTRTLQRKFKNQYQITASNYIKQRRMEIAKKALIIEGLSIGEASFRAGFNHTSNFVSAFKKLYGQTPTEYKKAHEFN